MVSKRTNARKIILSRKTTPTTPNTNNHQTPTHNVQNPTNHQLKNDNKMILIVMLFYPFKTRKSNLFPNGYWPIYAVDSNICLDQIPEQEIIINELANIITKIINQKRWRNRPRCQWMIDTRYIPRIYKFYIEQTCYSNLQVVETLFNDDNLHIHNNYRATSFCCSKPNFFQDAAQGIINKFMERPQ